MSSRSGPNHFRSSPSMVSNLTVLKVLRSFRHQTEKDTAAVSDSKYSGQVPVLSLQHGDVLALPFHQLWRGDSQRLLTLWNFETCTMCKPIDGVSSDGYRHSSGQISDAHLLSTTLRQKIDAQQHPQSGMRLDKTSDCGWQQPCLYQYIPVHCENMCKSYANIWLQQETPCHVLFCPPTPKYSIVKLTHCNQAALPKTAATAHVSLWAANMHKQRVCSGTQTMHQSALQIEMQQRFVFWRAMNYPTNTTCPKSLQQRLSCKHIFLLHK